MAGTTTRSRRRRFSNALFLARTGQSAATGSSGNNRLRGQCDGQYQDRKLLHDAAFALLGSDYTTIHAVWLDMTKG